MAYFPNGSDPAGHRFESQCDDCWFGDEPCPVALAQLMFNYDAANNKVATEILNTLVSNDGTCHQKAMMEDWKGKTGGVREHPGQGLLFRIVKDGEFVTAGDVPAENTMGTLADKGEERDVIQ